MPTGRLAKPFNSIANTDVTNAFDNVQPGDIVRIVGNGGQDQDLNTEGDAKAYEIGFNTDLGKKLSDGEKMSVPKGVTVMIDSGAVFKLFQAAIVVGSTTASVDRSGASLQVLGTPTQDVFFTSYDNESLGFDTNPLPTTPDPGDWGGLAIHHAVDRGQGRFVYENEGIFLNYINHADFGYGGGSVFVDSITQTINPIDLTKARPTVTFNTIRDSAQAAIAADPDSFEETNFHSPPYQFSGAFTSDVQRVGPHVRGNRLAGNSNNGLFVRVSTPAGSQLQPLTVAARFDDTDITHIISQTLVVQGTPGGPVFGEPAPPHSLVTLTQERGGALPVLAANSLYYRLTFVDALGNESDASDILGNTSPATATGRQAIRLANLPPAATPFVARKLYRSVTGVNGPYELVTQLDISATTYRDVGLKAGGVLNVPNPLVPTINRARLDARLAIDAGTIVKLESSRIEVTMGGQLLAEGRDGLETIFTSRFDDRYGAGGTFDTNDDGSLSHPAKGNWGGLFIGQMSSASIDNALITFGGGITPIEGAFAGFNAVEIHQAEVRLTNSILENKCQRLGGQRRVAPLGARVQCRRGRHGPRRAARHRREHHSGQYGAAPASTRTGSNSDLVRDTGRSTGPLDRIDLYGDNQGPLVRENQLAGN